MPTLSSTKSVPRQVVNVFLVISLLPIVLTLFGVNFGMTFHASLDTVQSISSLEEFSKLALIALMGAFVHFLLEWTGVFIALFTSLLAYIQYKITENYATAIIGLSLFFAANIDAFHALASAHIFTATLDSENFIPFTWAVSRLFNAVAILIGVAFYYNMIKQKAPKTKRYTRNTLILYTTFFLALSFFVVKVSASIPSLPRTQYPGYLLTRPFDVIPLVVYMIVLIALYKNFYRRQENIFTTALMWSMIPAIMTQLHMAFGSSELFDGHFNIAHFLKAVSYAIPFYGVTQDYIMVYQKNNLQLEEIKTSNQKLEAANNELEQFAYIASHDLQEPLRTITIYVDLLKKKFADSEDDKQTKFFDFILTASSRMSSLITSLLDYSRLGRKSELTKIDCNVMLDDIIKDIDLKIKENDGQLDIQELPIIYGYEVELRQLFQNLIDNALKFKKKDIAPQITISFEEKNDWLFKVSDNGIGIEPHDQQRIFQIFQRLHSQKDFEGSGIGLSHCKKIVQLHHGKIWIESQLNKGTTFLFTIKKDLRTS